METRYLYQFGRFRFDPAEHLLLRDGDTIPLTPKAFDILQALLESIGRLVTKEELMRRVWPDSFVEEANLTVNISAVRKALGDKDGQEYIQTVPKHGYRFVAPVTEIAEDASKPASRTSPGLLTSPLSATEERESVVAPAQETSPTVAGPGQYLRWSVLLGVLSLGMVIGTVSYLKRGPAHLSGGDKTHRLAVLPFQNLRQDSNSDFLGYSLADAVITKLGYVQSLRVRPSYAVAKYRDQVVDIPKVAADLNADTLLTGNFFRDGEDLRITCQLVDADTQNIRWKGAFDIKYDKLLTVHDNVAQEIVKGLELNLSPIEAEQLKPDKPIDPLAYEYYLRGVDLYSRSQFPTAIQMLEKSAQSDPHYALTWAYLGRSYNAAASFEFGGRDYYRKAQSAFERALALQPTQIEANVYTANWLTDTGRVEESVPLLRKTLKTNPDHAEVHWELGYAYRFAGMLKESLAECERARELDPGVKLTSSALNTYLYLGQYDRFLQSLPNSSDSAFVLFYRGFGEYYKKSWQDAARDFDRAFELQPALLQAQVGKALSYGITREAAKGLALLGEAEAKINERGVGDSEAIYKIAEAYAVLGDHASAMRVLRHSIENGFFSYPYFTTDPLLEAVRNQPEFVGLMKLAQARHEKFKRSFF